MTNSWVREDRRDFQGEREEEEEESRCSDLVRDSDEVRHTVQNRAIQAAWQNVDQ